MIMKRMVAVRKVSLVLGFMEVTTEPLELYK